MKYLWIGLVAILAIGFRQPTQMQSKMNQLPVMEVVLWKSVSGFSTEKAKQSVTTLNEFVSKQPGFISRKTALSKDGQFVDIVLWEDLNSAQQASEKAMQNEELAKVFNMMDQQEMFFKHFEIFNQLER